MEECKFHIATENYFIDANLESIVLDRDRYLFKEEDKLDFIYFLCQGELNIFHKNFLLWQAHQNEFIGISSFFIGEKRYSTSVKARQESTLYKIPLAEFRLALRKHHKLNGDLMKLFCERIDKTFSKGEDSIKYSRKKRLLNIVIRKAEELPKKDKLILGYTSSELAEMVNVSNSFANQFFDELQNRKLIKIKKNKVEVTDFKGLKIVANMKGIIENR